MNYRKLIRLFQAVEVGIVAAVAGLVWMSAKSYDLLAISLSVSELLAVAAVIFLGLALTPGMLRRIGVGLKLASILQPIRRHLGIMTFVCGFSHYLSGSVASMLFTRSIVDLNLGVLLGGMTLLSLTAPFLTSNDYSLIKLRKNWYKVQKLVYVSCGLLMLHLYFVKSQYLWLGVGLVGLQLGSFFVKRFKSVNR